MTVPDPVLVTGASTGIGRATVAALIAREARVVASVRREADEVSLLEEFEGAVDVVRFDLTDHDAIRAGIGGLAQLGGLVNNAGIAVPAPLEFLPIEDLRFQLEVNLIGQLVAIQAALPLLRAHGAGARIVNVGSVGGRVAGPMIGAYHMSKYGLAALTDTLRHELEPAGIRVALVEPGAVRTPIWQRGKDAADELLARMPDDAVEHYGPMIERATAEAERNATAGITASRVAEVIIDALASPRPRPRYLVGPDARVAGVVGYLPDRLKYSLIRRQFG